MRAFRRAQRPGYTMIELIMVIVISSIISLMFSNFLVGAFNNWIFMSGQRGLAFSSRAALYRIVREVRRINDNTQITVWGSNAITFKDVDGTTISYTQSGTNLTRGTAVLHNKLVSSEGLSFTYLTSLETVPATNAAISIVRVRLTTQDNSNKFVIESSAFIRPRTL